MKPILLTSKRIKKELLQKSNQEKKLNEYKFMDEQELMSHLFFSYDKRAIYYLMKKYHWKVENAICYLENMYFLKEEVTNSKMEFLHKLKQELEEENLLIKDELFPFYLRKSMVLYTEDIVTKKTKRILEEVEKYTIVKKMTEKKIEPREIKIYSFETIKEELHYVIEQICKLYESGVPLSNIKLVNAHSDYQKELKRLCFLYQLPIKMKEETSIFATKIGQEFYQKLLTMPISDLLCQLQESYPGKENEEVIQKLFSIVNEYHFCDDFDEEIKQLIYYDLIHTKKRSKSLKKGIEVVEIKEVNASDYVFFLGVNSDTVPETKKEEDYFSEKEKQELGLLSTKQENKILEEQLLKAFNRPKQRIITYKKQGKNGEVYPSKILEKVKGNLLVKDPLNSSYSRRYERLLLAASLDEYQKYGVVSENLKRYYPIYTTDSYQTYQNDYQKIEDNVLETYWKEKQELVLSYSSLDHYMKCKFRYYLDTILKLNVFESNFSAKIGSYYHAILEQMNEPDFDFERATSQFFKEETLSFKEQFLLVKLKEELKTVLAITKEYEALSSFKEKKQEVRIVLQKKGKIPVTIKGFIDKVMLYHGQNGSYISLIDYKTGGYDANLNHVYHGLGLQLPIYAYLIKQSEEWKQYQLCGFYIAPIFITEEKAKEETNAFDVKRDKMRLVGYSLDQEEVLSKFDPSYENSRMIKGMKMTKKGFGPYTKVLSTHQLDQLITYIDSLIQKAIKDIFEGDFKINPKQYQGKNRSCSYCPYEEICYKKYEDFEWLEEQKYQDFLGGANNEK